MKGPPVFAERAISSLTFAMAQRERHDPVTASHFNGDGNRPSSEGLCHEIALSRMRSWWIWPAANASQVEAAFSLWLKEKFLNP